jgi:putative holliday junction resolvase
MTVLGFDYGSRRIGVALGASGLARPLGMVDASGWREPVREFVTRHTPERLVVGLPRGLDGQETVQTAKARDFARQLEDFTKLPVDLIDEAGTSGVAEDRLRASGKRYDKGAIDAEAAAIIVQDYLDQA